MTFYVFRNDFKANTAVVCMALLGWLLQKKHWKLGRRRVAGVDEAGRGALAGPVRLCCR